MSTADADTLVTLLASRAAEVPNAGYEFLKDGKVVDDVGYGALDADARAIAARLQDAGVAAGAPVLLLYPPGLDFIRAFYGCLYAGAVAVPAYPPTPARLARTLPRLRSVAEDCGTDVILTTRMVADISERVLSLAPELERVRWIATDGDAGDPSAWKAPRVAASDLALLQYTSGSTGTPRGVMLTHENLLHNQRIIREAFGHEDRLLMGVSWLPMYHDMGLIGNVLQPLFMRGSCAMMSPLEFLQSPVRWLQAISELRANTSGGPNFAFDLAARLVTDEQLAALDLSSWRVAYCGAEPIRAETLRRFAARFAPAGFDAAALLPCYGLAEASLIVTGASRSAGMTVLDADDDALRRGELRSASGDGARPIVGCGPAVGDQEVITVADGARCAPGKVGEIWVRGRSVGKGYYGKPEASAETFETRLADGAGPYLRTGDLGAFDANGELFVVGRVKDMLILRGLNHYPHDIEKSVEEAWPGLRPGSVVAFAIDGDDGDELAIVAEYDVRARDGVAWDAVVDSVRSAVAREHDITTRVIVIAAPGQVPKTSSGKIQRSETRRRHVAGELEELHRWTGVTTEPVVVATEVPLRTAAEIEQFITSWISEAMGHEAKGDETFSEVGMDSLSTVRLIDAVGSRLGRELSAIIAIDYPTPETLAAHLAAEETD